MLHRQWLLNASASRVALQSVSGILLEISRKISLEASHQVTCWCLEVKSWSCIFLVFFYKIEAELVAVVGSCIVNCSTY
jgi:hypothetical protein